MPTDIKITPGISSIEFLTGSTSSSLTLNRSLNGLVITNTETGTTTTNQRFRVVGNTGQIFTVVDSTTGSLLAATNYLGVPIFDVRSDNITYATNLIVSTSANIGAVEAKNAGYTILTSDMGKTFTCSASTTQTFNLPSVDSTNLGIEYTIVKLGSGAVIIDAADSDTIEDSGAGATIYTQDDGIATVTLKLVTGTQWIIKFANGSWISTT